MTKEDDPVAVLKQMMLDAVHGRRFDLAMRHLHGQFDDIVGPMHLSTEEQIIISLANVYRLARTLEDPRMMDILLHMLEPVMPPDDTEV